MGILIPKEIKLEEDMVTKCVDGCDCKRFTQDQKTINGTFINPNRCICTHSKMNHVVTKNDEEIRIIKEKQHKDNIRIIDGLNVM